MSFPESWEVPTFEVAYERPKRASIAICVFVINEGARIQAQLARMKAWTGMVDIIVADGGSTDGSLDSNTLASNDVTALLVKTGPGKLSAQMRMAFAWAMQAGYEAVIAIDGNGKDGVEAIPKFVHLLREGWDHLQGSRYLPGGHHAHTPLLRHVGVRLLHAPLVSLAAGFRYTDTTNGFRGYSRRFLLDPRVQPFRGCFTGYELHYYLAIRAARLGFRCREVPVSRVYPAHGPAPTKISPIRGSLLVLRTLFRAVAGGFNPGSS